MLLLKPPSKCSEEDKARHPSFRRYTRRYLKKKQLVRDVWITSGVIMLCVPIHAMPVLVLGTTFLAFMILDETP
jgi:hypothetical protein